MSNSSSDPLTTGGGEAIGGASVGRDSVGRDSIGGDQLHTKAGDVSGSVVGSKNVRQTHTRNDSPDVTVNNYERVSHTADLVDRLEERVEIQIDRLSDNVSNRISTLETNMNVKLGWIERDIEELQRAPSRFLIPLLTIIATLLMIAALYYFGGGLYSLSNELKQQRIENQKSGVVGKPPGFTWVGR